MDETLALFMIQVIKETIVSTAYRHLDDQAAWAFLEDFDKQFAAMDVEDLRSRALSGSPNQ
jgi:hypothetical protein